MNVWKGLSLLAIGSLLSVSVASGEHGAPYDRMDVPFGGAWTESESGLVEDYRAESDDSQTTVSDVTEGWLLEGEVAALDAESGHLLLSTESGILSLRTMPEELSGVRIGDTIQVALFDEPQRD